MKFYFNFSNTHFKLIAAGYEVEEKYVICLNRIEWK